MASLHCGGEDNSITLQHEAADLPSRLLLHAVVYMLLLVAWAYFRTASPTNIGYRLHSIWCSDYVTYQPGLALHSSKVDGFAQEAANTQATVTTYMHIMAHASTTAIELLLWLTDIVC